jgi:serine/threonine protein kinase
MRNRVGAERYQLQIQIGRGGMATVYRGYDTRLDRTVAIKVLRKDNETDQGSITRFEREARAASSLVHPNVVLVFDYYQTSSNYYIVMEFINGVNLRRYLQVKGILDTDRTVIIAHDVALGLEAAHSRGIVHRDVKPHNILVGRDGSIKLTDFGIASFYRELDLTKLTAIGQVLGTPRYFAPEQAQREAMSPATDIYALGIVMYEMITGCTPFDGDSHIALAMQHILKPPPPPSHLKPDIPPALEEIIMCCLEKSPEKRFSDGRSLAYALENADL